jgi:hypothetical protein
MKPGSQNDVRSDARLVEERLKVWRLSLNETQTATLIKQKRLVLSVTRPFEGLKKLKVVGGIPVLVRLEIDDKRAPDWFIQVLEGELEKAEKAYEEADIRYRRTVHELPNRKDGIKRLEGSFFSQLEYVPGDTRKSWHIFRGTYVTHRNVSFLVDQYYGEFIRYKASRGETKYTLRELRNWLIPREKKYIQRLEKRLPYFKSARDVAARIMHRKYAELEKLKAKRNRKKPALGKSDERAAPKGRRHLLDK